MQKEDERHCNGRARHLLFLSLLGRVKHLLFLYSFRGVLDLHSLNCRNPRSVPMRRPQTHASAATSLVMACQQKAKIGLPGNAFLIALPVKH